MSVSTVEIKNKIENKAQNKTLKTILEMVIDAFNAGNASNISSEQIPIKLFEILSNLIIEQRWIYEPLNGQVISCNSKCQVETKVNCFGLSSLFIEICQHFGVKGSLHEYISRYSKKMGKNYYKGVYGKFICFDEKARKQYLKEKNIFRFDNHFVVKIEGRYYDLTFLCHYDNQLDTMDDSFFGRIFSEASNNQGNLVEQLLRQNTKFDINQQDNTGRTLLHWACHYEDAQLAAFLLQDKNANPTILNCDWRDPLDLVGDLNSGIYELYLG